MTKTIPFGELNLTPAQVNKMGKALLDGSPLLMGNTWEDLPDNMKEHLICDFILTIPKTLGVIGLKVGKK